MKRIHGFVLMEDATGKIVLFVFGPKEKVSDVLKNRFAIESSVSFVKRRMYRCIFRRNWPLFISTDQ